MKIWKTGIFCIACAMAMTLGACENMSVDISEDGDTLTINGVKEALNELTSEITVSTENTVNTENTENTEDAENTETIYVQVTSVENGKITAVTGEITAFGGGKSKTDKNMGVFPGSEGNAEETGEVGSGFGALSGSEGFGGMFEMPTEGERPEMPVEGEVPEMPTEGERPEMPVEGERPEMPVEGEIPEMPVEGEIPQMPTEGEIPEGFGGFPGMKENFGEAGGYAYIFTASENVMEFEIPETLTILLGSMEASEAAALTDLTEGVILEIGKTEGVLTELCVRTDILSAETAESMLRERGNGSGK